MASKTEDLALALLLMLETYDAGIYLSQLEFCWILLNFSSVCEGLLVAHYLNPMNIQLMYITGVFTSKLQPMYTT